jgi:hypothetical protein
MKLTYTISALLPFSNGRRHNSYQDQDTQVRRLPRQRFDEELELFVADYQRKQIITSEMLNSLVSSTAELLNAALVNAINSSEVNNSHNLKIFLCKKIQPYLATVARALYCSLMPATEIDNIFRQISVYHNNEIGSQLARLFSKCSVSSNEVTELFSYIWMISANPALGCGDHLNRELVAISNDITQRGKKSVAQLNNLVADCMNMVGTPQTISANKQSKQLPFNDEHLHSHINHCKYIIGQLAHLTLYADRSFARLLPDIAVSDYIKLTVDFKRNLQQLLTSANSIAPATIDSKLQELHNIMQQFTEQTLTENSEVIHLAGQSNRVAHARIAHRTSRSWCPMPSAVEPKPLSAVNMPLPPLTRQTTLRGRVSSCSSLEKIAEHNWREEMNIVFSEGTAAAIYDFLKQPANREQFQHDCKLNNQARALLDTNPNFQVVSVPLRGKIIRTLGSFYQQCPSV